MRSGGSCIPTSPGEAGQPGDGSRQLWLDLDRPSSEIKAGRAEVPTGQDEVEGESRLNEPSPPTCEGRDLRFSEEELTETCRQLLVGIGLPGAARLVEVRWNRRLRSTAGYASFPAWRIELNPRLRDFEGQTERTLKHELAHLIAYHQAGRRRIDPHGTEWRAACAALGIPDEKACHHLPLPRSQQKRHLAYQCPACGHVLRRVRRFRRPTACLTCCNRFAGGRYDARFRFVLLPSGEEPS